MIQNLKKIYIALISVLLILVLVASSEAVKGDKRETKTFSLGNGLDIIIISDPDVHRSAAAL